MPFFWAHLFSALFSAFTFGLLTISEKNYGGCWECGRGTADSKLLMFKSIPTPCRSQLECKGSLLPQQYSSEPRKTLACITKWPDATGWAAKVNYYRKERTKCFLAILLDIKVALFNPLKRPLISGSGPKWTNSDLMSDLLLLISLRSASAFRTGKLQLSYSSFPFFHYLLTLYECRNMGDKSSFPPWQFHLHIGNSLSGKKTSFVFYWFLIIILVTWE